MDTEHEKNSNNSLSIKKMIQKARLAQAQVNSYTQEQIDDVCLAVGWEVYNDHNIEILAQEAVAETGMGNVADKIKKHKTKVLGVLNDIKGALSVGLIDENRPKKIKKYAKPVGVVGALTPVTNPTATPASNAISILKGRNAVIFAPHPRSKKSSKLAVDFMRQGLSRVGAPCDLIQIIAEPSVELTTELMRQVDIIIATGGQPMVKAAYSSGTPAYGVGPGNSVQIIAEDADLTEAAAKIHVSKIFDYATSCSSENSIIVHSSIYNTLIDEFKKLGTLLLNRSEKNILEKWMWQTAADGKRTLNPKIVAQSADKLAAEAGISKNSDANNKEPTMLLIEGSLPPEQDLFAGEKLAPVLTIWKYTEFDEAVELLKKITNYAGRGHSCGIFTHTQTYIERLAIEMETSRIMVRQPQAPANGGNFFNGMPSTVTLGCGTWGGNITTENINYRHFLNITWVSEPFEPCKPSDQDIWGDFFTRYKKDVK